MTEPGGGTGPSGAVRLTVAAGDAEVVADRLFSLGASAVSETPGAHDTVELVADVELSVVLGAGLTARPLGPDELATGHGQAPALARRCGRRLVLRPLDAAPLDRADLDRADLDRVDLGTVDLDGADLDGADGGEPATPLVEVLIDPGPAFGAGSHASTRVCLAALEPLAADAATVLDVGSGTGVLGVAALLLGAGTLRAIDVDADAVAATGRAARLNDVQDRVVVDDAPLDRVEGRFDLVLANLLAPVIEQLGAQLVERVAEHGRVVVGGVLEHQLARVEHALAPLVLLERRIEQGWLAATFGAHEDL